MSLTCLLQAPPGAGKTTMACLTAVRKPVHVIDIDRKINNMISLKQAREKSELTYWEVAEKLAEEGLYERAKNVAQNKKPTQQPKGWIKFAELVSKLPTDLVSKNAGTWVIDSFTMATDHLTSLILYSSEKGRGFMNQREWGAYLQMCKETVVALYDGAKEHDKDLIILVHERNIDKPAKDARIFYDAEGERHIIGSVTTKTTPSVAGQFGEMMSKYFEEVYSLKVIIKNGKPEWVCRVHPEDGRDLRTSFNTKEILEFPCDFREIWK